MALCLFFDAQNLLSFTNHSVSRKQGRDQMVRANMAVVSSGSKIDLKHLLVSAKKACVTRFMSSLTHLGP